MWSIVLYAQYFHTFTLLRVAFVQAGAEPANAMDMLSVMCNELDAVSRCGAGAVRAGMCVRHGLTQTCREVGTLSVVRRASQLDAVSRCGAGLG